MTASTRSPEEGWVVGRHAVAELVLRWAGKGQEGAAPVERVLVADEPGPRRWWQSGPGQSARTAGALVQWVPRAALDRLAGGVAHQGVAARVAARAWLDLETLVEKVPRPALLVLVDGIEDPRNLGAIIRSAAAAGAGGVIVPERRNAGLSPATAKAAAGTLELLDVARVKNPVRAMEDLAKAGIWTLGLAAGARDIWSGVDLCRPTCLVVGAESTGLARLVRERCDDVVGLPLAPGVESLNAAVAVGVALYEAVRQRRSAT